MQERIIFGQVVHSGIRAFFQFDMERNKMNPILVITLLP